MANLTRTQWGNSVYKWEAVVSDITRNVCVEVMGKCGICLAFAQYKQDNFAGACNKCPLFIQKICSNERQKEYEAPFWRLVDITKCFWEGTKSHDPEYPPEALTLANKILNAIKALEPKEESTCG